MGMAMNYEQRMEQIILENCAGGRAPKLLLHSCCAPCSSYCIERLGAHFSVTVYYYNPNIYPPDEYGVRVKEQERFIRGFSVKHPLSFVAEDYAPQEFYAQVKGMEDLPEGKERCFACFELRLRKTAEYASQNGFDFFATTLSVSPLKNAEKLNEIGSRLEQEYKIRYLYSDFKKKNGYKRSTEISKEYGMYRQYYCGCIYSKQERDAQIAAKNQK